MDCNLKSSGMHEFETTGEGERSKLVEVRMEEQRRLHEVILERVTRGWSESGGA